MSFELAVLAFFYIYTVYITSKTHWEKRKGVAHIEKRGRQMCGGWQTGRRGVLVYRENGEREYK